MYSGKASVCGSAIVFICVLALTSAFVEVEAQTGIDTRPSAMSLMRDRSKQDELSGRSEWTDFKGRYGQNWRVLWRESTGTPHRVFGGSIRLLTTGPVTAAGIISACEEFVSENASLLQADMENLTLAKTINVMGKWGVIYKEYYEGLEVYGGRIDFRIARDGTLLQFGSDFYPNISVSVDPAISPEAAIQEAVSLFDEVGGGGSCEPSDLIVLRSSLRAGPRRSITTLTLRSGPDQGTHAASSD